MQDVKLDVLGGGGVGKSSFIINFILHIFPEEYDPTIEDSYRKQIMIGEQPVVVDILDTTGEDKYVPLRDRYMSTSEGFIIVYSITNKCSYEEVGLYVEQIARVKDVDHSPTVIVGNKCDLETERQVQTHEGEMLAEKFNAAFFETSAMFGINVYQAVHVLATEVYQSRGKNENTSRKKMANKKECAIC